MTHRQEFKLKPVDPMRRCKIAFYPYSVHMSLDYTTLQPLYPLTLFRTSKTQPVHIAVMPFPERLPNQRPNAVSYLLRIPTQDQHRPQCAFTSSPFFQIVVSRRCPPRNDNPRADKTVRTLTSLTSKQAGSRQEKPTQAQLWVKSVSLSDIPMTTPTRCL